MSFLISPFRMPGWGEGRSKSELNDRRSTCLFPFLGQCDTLGQRDL